MAAGIGLAAGIGDMRKVLRTLPDCRRSVCLACHRVKGPYRNAFFPECTRCPPTLPWRSHLLTACRRAALPLSSRAQLRGKA